MRSLLPASWHNCAAFDDQGVSRDRHFTNPNLKALLVSQWGDYGAPPSQSPFAVYATIVMHYLNGAYYPVGGAGSIAQSVKAIVAAQGGRFLLNREVTEILIEKGRAVGVNVRKVNAATESPLESYSEQIAGSPRRDRLP